MTRNIWVLCLFALAVLSISASRAEAKKVKYLLNKPQCTEKNLRKIELVVAKAMVVGPNGRKFPENYSQMKVFCKDTTRMVHQVEKFFKDCYEKSVRNYANVIIYSIKSNLRRFCGKKGSKIVKEYIKLGPCANKYVQPYDICLVKFMNQTKQLINIKDDRIKIPHTCCNFAESIKCVEDFLNNIDCIQPHVPNLIDLFRSGAQSQIDLLCGEYSDQTDACARLGSPPKPVTPNQTKYNTVVFVLIDLLESFKELPNSPGLV